MEIDNNLRGKYCLLSYKEKIRHGMEFVKKKQIEAPISDYHIWKWLLLQKSIHCFEICKKQIF